jgi:Uma2 family endonuclease
MFAAMAAPKRRATYEDLMQVPETKVAEIIDGELIVSPRPGPPHTHAASALGFDLGGAFHGPPGSPTSPGGWWILLQPELHLEDDVLVPDWAGWRRARMPALPSTAYFPLAPDWVCEILFLSTGRMDRSAKMHAYARAAVAHLWLVDPSLRTVEVYRLEAGHWIVVDTYAADATVRAEPFDAIELRLASWWAPEPFA